MSSNIIVTFSDSEDSFSDDDDNKYNCSMWSLIPEPVFFKILKLKILSSVDILRAGTACRRWNIIAKDDFLWKKLFQRDFKVDPNIGLRPGTVY